MKCIFWDPKKEWWYTK